MHSASRDARTVDEESSQVQNPPFSALIRNLGRRLKITARFTGPSAFFAKPSKPGLCLESPVSPIIAARQRMFSKIGGLSDRPSRRESETSPKAPESLIASYSRLKPGLSQATIRYPIEDTEFWDMD